MCGDGTQTLDFTYVTSVVGAAMLAAEAPQASGSVLHMGCRASYTVLDLVGAVEDATGHSLDPRFGLPRPGDVKRSFANIDRARARLGCEPHVAFDDGVGMTYRAPIGG